MKTDCNYLFSSRKFLSLKQIFHRMADNEVAAKHIVRKFHGNEVYNFHLRFLNYCCVWQAYSSGRSTYMSIQSARFSQYDAFHQIKSAISLPARFTWPK